jgi:hypothetical protein
MELWQSSFTQIDQVLDGQLILNLEKVNRALKFGRREKGMITVSRLNIFNEDRRLQGRDYEMEFLK